MKSIYKLVLLACCLSTITLLSCKEDEDTRVVYPHSTPVIESLEIDPSSFIYGDSVTFTAKVSDQTTPLSTLTIKMIVNDVLIAEEELRTPGNNAEVRTKFKVSNASQLPDNADVEVQLTLVNVEGDKTVQFIEGIKGNRKYYEQLYLILDNGTVYNLKSQTNKSDKYSIENVMIKANNIRYRIAEKITSDNQIDFTGDVWGYIGGTIQLVDETGDYITTTNNSLDYITSIVFDNYNFVIDLLGDKLNPNDISLENFEEVTIGGENLMKLSRTIEKDQSLNLFDQLASSDIVYNMDYFDRVSQDQVKFLGEQGTYTLYYSPTRKTMMVDPSLRSYPDILLVNGDGLGYPSKVKSEAHTAWDFNAPFDAIIFRRIATDLYQGTVYLDVENANFKPFENRDWGNEKKSTDFTMPALIAKDTDLGKSDGNWYAAPDAVSGNYKITINLSTKEVTAESVVLP